MGNYIITSKDMNKLSDKPLLIATKELVLQYLMLLKAEKDKAISTYFRDENFNTLLTNDKILSQLTLGQNVFIYEGNQAHFTCCPCPQITANNNLTH